MINALIAGTKTQTRRIVQARRGDHGFVMVERQDGAWWPHRSIGGEPLASPYGTIGDRLRVKEAWRTVRAFDPQPPRDIPRTTSLWFEADGSPPAAFQAGRYRNARFMMEWMSRLALEVLDIRAERLQDCNAADAAAEGLIRVAGQWQGAPDLPATADPVAAYRMLWERINGPGTWDANPWVWRVEFRPFRK
jgi:hypothetical protein